MRASRHTAESSPRAGNSLPEDGTATPLAPPDPARVLSVAAPTVPALPLVYDSPHSGNIYPPDFETALPHQGVRHTEDMFVEELFAHVPADGAALLQAHFPRAYIDPNRSAYDIDEDLLETIWPGLVRPTAKVRRGKGLLRTHVGKQPLYPRKLTHAEVAHRIHHYHAPYHAALQDLMDASMGAFGQAWHVNCHSWTPPKLGRDGRPVNHIDFCLGDRDGSTCDPAFTAAARDFLEGRGYVVRVNRPFRGMELVRLHGTPQQGRHSLQIEINRHLYMNPDTLERKEDAFPRLRDLLHELTAALAAFVRARV